MTPILKVVGWFLSKCEYIYSVYKLKNINVLLGKGERFVGYPYILGEWRILLLMNL